MHASSPAALVRHFGSIGFTVVVRVFSVMVFSVMVFSGGIAQADQVPIIEDVQVQPFKAQVKRVIESLNFLGEPLTLAEAEELQKALDLDHQDSVAKLQNILDRRVLALVNINPESRVKVNPGEMNAELVQQGWSVFLVKVHNQAGVTAPLRVASANAAPLVKRSTGSPEPEQTIKKSEITDRWCDLSFFDDRPMKRTLSGLLVEYRILQVYSRDSGQREAGISFNVGQGTQDIGFRNSVAILFNCKPGVSVRFNVFDHDGKPTTGQFVIRDSKGRVYPAKSRRLAPDFFFHDQIYRSNGEQVILAPGKYDVTYSRGPEYRVLKKEMIVPSAKTHQENFRLVRWIRAADFNWYSGDHHVHAAGCSHYESPTEGVTPEDMMRHILGEDLNVGCVLSWGPCWYHQKEFFNGETHRLSVPNYLMRYDVEVSGFPSSHAGHLCLLNLTEDDYVYPAPTRFEFGRTLFDGQKTTRIEEWPSWDLPVLKWGKEQGGVVGFSHSGWGLEVPGETLPNFNMPKFDGIGANEYIVDVCHDVCDFISSVDTPIVWELAIWYHTLNCGYDCRISGETDFPCIYGDRVGLGRVYVQLPQGSKLNYQNWVQGLKAGRSYVGDGLSHILDFKVNGLGVGQTGDGNRASYLAAKTDESLKISASVAALLGTEPDESIRQKPLHQKPYWHVERARVDNSRRLPVELIVNGEPVAKKEIEADGELNQVTFDYTIKKSSWVALRIFPTCHTNPVFVEVDQKPIRANRKSFEWCIKAVDVCWNAKVKNIRPHERLEARAAYDFAI
ncbi:MAG: CehA/McbA family metallohydrolase, partial [Planctomycetota bacterium]|nr:CehA/McbA family metallohydrolase [Planctomycetota bacterium]